MPPSPGLNAGFFVSTDNELIFFERFAVPNPLIEVQNSSGLGDKIWVSRENPAAMLPRLDCVLMQPPPYRGYR